MENPPAHRFVDHCHRTLPKIDEALRTAAEHDELPPEVLGHLLRAAISISTALTEHYSAILVRVEEQRRLQAGG